MQGKNARKRHGGMPDDHEINLTEVEQEVEGLAYDGTRRF